MALLAILAGSLATIILAIVFRAWVLTILWAWFIVPFGIPALTITTALGISLIVGMFTAHLQTKPAEKGSKDIPTLVGQVASQAFGAPLVILLMGWIVTWFM